MNTPSTRPSDIAMVIPSNGRMGNALEQLLVNSGLPRGNVILVRTDQAWEPNTECLIVPEYGEINIHRWWNSGIEAAHRVRPSYIAVANDDILINRETLPCLADALKECGAMLATPGARFHVYRRLPLWRSVLDGALWMMRADCPLAADEGYRWAFGDFDLDIRARFLGSGVVTVPVTFQHPTKSAATIGSATLMELATQDARLFKQNHPVLARFFAAFNGLLTLSRRIKSLAPNALSS